MTVPASWFSNNCAANSTSLAGLMVTNGVVDGIVLAQFYGAAADKVKKSTFCVAGMTDVQVAAILEKELRDHPAKWHESAHVMFGNAMFSSCSK